MNEQVSNVIESLKTNQPQNIDPKQIAMAELVMAAALFYTAGKTQSLIPKVATSVSALYLAYGAYLNSKGRVLLLPPKG